MAFWDPVLATGLAWDTSWREAAAQRTASPSVHSSFPHALNLSWCGVLLAVLSASGRAAPGALLTDASSFPLLAPGTPVRAGASSLRVGSLTVSLGAVRQYSCSAAVPAVFSPAPPAALAAALREVTAKGPFAPAAGQTPLARAAQRRLAEGRLEWKKYVSHYLRTGSTAGAREVARRLVGLGAGLTPSGDDYLVGTLAALHHLPAAPFATLSRAVGVAVRSAAARTTDVSAHFLAAAASGLFHVDLRAAATAALTGADMEDAFARVHQIGATSGYDALVGLTDTLSALHPALPRPPTRVAALL